MRPVIRDLGIGSFVIPLNTYAEAGCAYSATSAVVVDTLANKEDTTSIIATIASSTGGNFLYPADALYVTTTAPTTITVIQYGT